MIHVPKTAGTSCYKAIESLKIPTQHMGYSLYPKCDTTLPFTNMEHVSVQRLISRGVFTQEWYDSCFKFAFVRNPWDRLVSLYSFLQYRLRQKRERESNQYLDSFESFAWQVTEPTCSYVRPVGKLTTDDWSQANQQVRWIDQGVDFIGKFEYLHSDWARICGMIGIPYTALSVHRKSERTLLRYQDYYADDELKKLVGDFYHEDIERFGYQYED
jgi:hypothetical protein